MVISLKKSVCFLRRVISCQPLALTASYVVTYGVTSIHPAQNIECACDFHFSSRSLIKSSIINKLPLDYMKQIQIYSV